MMLIAAIIRKRAATGKGFGGSESENGNARRGGGARGMRDAV